MFQTFYTDTIESNYIKNLIKNTFLPTIPTVANGDYLIKGFKYIYKSDLIECTASGFITDKYKGAVCSEDTYCSDKLKCEVIIYPAQYKIIQAFDFDTFVPGLTYNFISNKNYYDSDTHKHLGNLLRCVRDLMDIDLMPFYNCYNSVTTDAFTLSTDVNRVRNDNNILYIVPIKFNKSYTIYIDSDTEVSIKSLLLNKVGRVYKYYNGKKVYVDDSIDKIKKYYSTQFKMPITHISATTNPDIYNFEDNLYLAIQVSKLNTSSLVVLEGDYTDKPKNKIMSLESFSELKYSDFNEVSELSLSLLNDGNSYAFSNRLIEYLLLNVITNQEQIKNNIGRVQDKLKTYPYSLKDYDVWDNKIKFIAFNKYFNSNKVKQYDINGNIDKDIENSLYNYRG